MRRATKIHIQYLNTERYGKVFDFILRDFLVHVGIRDAIFKRDF